MAFAQEEYILEPNRLRRRGSPEGRSPFGGVWGCPPDTSSTSSLSHKVEDVTYPRVDMVFVQEEYIFEPNRLRRRGSPEGRSPFGGGLGVSPRYKFHLKPLTQVEDVTYPRVDMVFVQEEYILEPNRLRRKGSPEGRSPFGGGLGVSPRYNFHPLLARKGAWRCSKRVFQQPAGGLRRKGSPEGRSPFGGGLGVSPRYNFRPFLTRKGAGRCSKRVFQQPAKG